MEYNKNLEILEKIRPSFFQKVAELDTEKMPKQADNIETVSARDGNPITVITVKGTKYRLNSAFRPLAEAEKWVQQFNFTNMNNNVTMYGFGNGYFVKALLDSMPKTDFLLIYEPSAELFLHVLETYDITSILADERVIIGVEGINGFDFHKALRDVYSVYNIGNNTIPMHPVYDKLFLDQFQSFKEEIKNSAETARIYYNTLLLLAKASFQNSFLNIPKIRNSISITQLKKVWTEDIPVILVAAGPSVEESIEDLKRVNGKVIIVAVDRIVGYLMERGIRPDFAVTLDPKKNAQNFSKEGGIDIPLFCLMQSKPAILDKQTGRKIICGASSYMAKQYEAVIDEVPNVPTSGSVATYAVSILSYLGVKTILLVGQDLAYSGQVTHAGGVISNPHAKAAEFIEGINGEKVRARYDWVEYLTWYEDFIETHPSIKMIDTKKRGALIHGSILMSLNDGLKEYMNTECNVIDKMNQIPSTFSDEEFTRMKQQLIEEKNALSKMKQKAKEGIGLSSDLINLVKQNKSQSASVDSKVKKIKEITAYLKDTDFYVSLDEMVIQYMKEKYIQVFNTKDDEKDNLLNVYDSSRSYFEGVLEAAKYAEPVLQETIDNL